MTKENILYKRYYMIAFLCALSMVNIVYVIEFIAFVVGDILGIEAIYNLGFTDNPFKQTALTMIPIYIISLILFSILIKVNNIEEKSSNSLKIVFSISVISFIGFILYVFIMCETEYRFTGLINNILVYSATIIGSYACLLAFLKLKYRKDIIMDDSTNVFVGIGLACIKVVLFLAFITNLSLSIVNFLGNDIEEKEFKHNGKEYVCQIETPFLASSQDSTYMYYEKKNIFIMKKTKELTGSLNKYID